MKNDNLLAVHLAERKLKFLPSAHYIYAIFCEDPETKSGFVKFGYSKNIFQRFASLQTGCPLPIRYYAICKISNNAHHTWLIEQRLHRKFESRKSSGEWFRFDFSSQKDKADFNHGCREILGADATGKTWEKFSAADLARLNKEQQLKYLKTRNNQQIYKRAGHSASRRDAWRELKRFGMSSQIR